MSLKNTIGQKKRWSDVDAAERSRQMRLLVGKRWDKMSAVERRAYCLKMVLARKKKNNGKTIQKL